MATFLHCNKLIANFALNKPCLPIYRMNLWMEDCCSKFQKRSAFRKTENNEIIELNPKKENQVSQGFVGDRKNTILIKSLGEC